MYYFNKSSLQVDQHLHLTTPRNVAHQTLEDQLVYMANTYRNSSIAPFHAKPLINAYNAYVECHMQFATGQEGCAMEFLGHGGLLGH